MQKHVLALKDNNERVIALYLNMLKFLVKTRTRENENLQKYIHFMRQ